MIRPYLRDLINEHKPITESNNKENKENEENYSVTNRAEWKIQLAMQNSCIFTKDFEETRTIYSKNEPVEILLGRDIVDIFDTLFNTPLQRFQHAQET